MERSNAVWKERCDGSSLRSLDGCRCRDGAFAVVSCMINTLGNFGAAQVPLLREMRRAGGLVVAGCYSLQAEAAQREWYAALHAAGILGPVDEARSTPERCVTQDGYESARFTRESLAALFHSAGLSPAVTQPIPELLIAVA